MKRIRIGILDEEKEYVMNLTAYLQRYGKGKWDLTAFTNEKSLVAYLEKRTLDILAGTDRRTVMQIERDKKFARLWLANDLEDLGEDKGHIYSVYRFQSAEKIGQCLEGIVRQTCTDVHMEKPIVALYSPVGRCGKTSLALDIVKSGTYGRWLYFGLEDYSSFEINPKQQEILADEVLYYWKEQREDKLLELLEQAENVIATGSFFCDGKQLDENDMKWFKEVVQKSGYRGVVFDMGTGIIQNLQVFEPFDHLLVPYVEEERAMVKKSNFERLFDVSSMEECKERIHFLDMNKKSEVKTVTQRIFGSDNLG